MVLLRHKPDKGSLEEGTFAHLKTFLNGVDLGSIKNLPAEKPCTADFQGTARQCLEIPWSLDEPNPDMKIVMMTPPTSQGRVCPKVKLSPNLTEICQNSDL